MIVIDVPMLPPSTNHMHKAAGRGQRVLSDEARQWREMCGLLAIQAQRDQAWAIPEHLFFGMELWYGDHRTNDIDNRVKAAIDAVAIALQFNDQRVLQVWVEHRGVTPRKPHTRITIAAIIDPAELSSIMKTPR